MNATEESFVEAEHILKVMGRANYQLNISGKLACTDKQEFAIVI